MKLSQTDLDLTNISKQQTQQMPSAKIQSGGIVLQILLGGEWLGLNLLWLCWARLAPALAALQ